jgi:hypothetical protein
VPAPFWFAVVWAAIWFGGQIFNALMVVPHFSHNLPESLTSWGQMRFDNLADFFMMFSPLWSFLALLVAFLPGQAKPGASVDSPRRRDGPSLHAPARVDGAYDNPVNEARSQRIECRLNRSPTAPVDILKLDPAGGRFFAFRRGHAIRSLGLTRNEDRTSHPACFDA